MLTPKFLILAGDGINCERETAFAFEKAGADYQIVHINDLLRRPTLLSEYQGLALPGGFSFGDELGSGQILALKIRHGLSEEFERFVDQQNPIIGICNGFQVLCRLGVLPFPEQERVMALGPNRDGHFVDKWVELSVERESVCKWTQGLPSSLELPVRHGEGRVVLSNEKKTFALLKAQGQVPFSYKEDFNGSYGNIAGVCDRTGLILGMMPHPEAFLFQATYRKVSKTPLNIGEGAFLFKSIVKFLKGA